MKDANLGRIVRTEYDLSDRPCQVEQRDSATNDLLYKTRLKYDKLGNLAQFAEKAGSDSHTSAYTYDRDNRVTEIDYDGTTQKVKYAYDELGRVKTRTAENGNAAGKLTSTYGYAGGGYGTNSTTPLVTSIAQSSGAGAAMNFAYAYDNRGNITSETRNGAVTTYAYDALGQLTRVNDPHENATWVFNYDRGGNITSKVKYAYTTGTLGTAQQTIPYTYGDVNWKDKLTAYNGQAISYDAIGNPLNDGTWSYTWGAGRQLRQMSKTGTTVQFKYDHNGLRTQKIVTENGATTTTNYTLHGKLITRMTRGTDILHFFCDAQSRPTKVNFNGTLYTYVHNLQGDIVGILDGNGTLVVEYKYDAWGRKLSVTGSLATTLGVCNPFRYRGYVYDEETGLYYVSYRYYNATICRFINCDETDALSETRGNLSDKNVFAYCDNDPISRRDAIGDFWHLIVGAVVGVAATVIGQVASSLSEGKSFKDAIKSVGDLTAYDYAAGAISGALAASGIGKIGATVANAAISGTTYVANCLSRGEKPKLGDFMIEVGSGVASGLIGGSGVNGAKLRGITRTSKTYLKTLVSPKKIAMYTGKIARCSNKAIEGVIRTVGGAAVSRSGVGLIRRLSA